MKKNIIILLMVFTCIIASILIIAQRKEGEEIIPPNQVNESIQTFTKLLNDQNVQSFGLKNIEQLKTLKPGKQYSKYMIGLDDIKKYKAGDDPEKIIKALPSAEVSLVDESGKILTSIEFTKAGGKWKTSGFGLTPDLTSVRNTQRIFSDSVASSANNGRLVSIPALRTSFIAVTGATGLDFIVLEDNANLDFRKGSVISASDALGKLVPVAALYNGLPD